MEFYQAILDDDRITVQAFLTNGVNVNSIYRRETALTLAIENGRKEIASMLIADPTCDLDAGNQFEKTPLFCAAQCGEVTLVNLLLKQGANVDKQDISGVTPLGATAWYDRAAAAEVLISAGANLNKENKNGETPLYRACDNVSSNVVKILLQNGCDVNIPTITSEGVADKTALMASIPSRYRRDYCGKKMSTMIEVMSNLLRHGADVDAVDESGNTALHIAVEKNEIHAAFLLMENDCDTSIVNKEGLSPLNIALLTNKQNYQMAFFLILFGFPDIASLCKENDENKNWIHLILNGKQSPIASEAERQMIFKMLLEETGMYGYQLTHFITGIERNNNNDNAVPEKVSDILFLQNFINAEIPLSLQKTCRRTIRKSLGRHFLSKMNELQLSWSLKKFIVYGLDVKICHPITALELQMAITEGDSEKFNQIIDSGIDVNMCLFGKPPLTIAAETGQVTYTKVLLDHGAVATIQDLNGDSALHLSARNGHDKILELLFPYIQDVNLKNSYGNTPLHEACSHGKFTSARLILENGGDLSICDKVGIYPVHYAAGSGDVTTIVQMLDKNSSTCYRDKYGNTALHVACSKGLIYLKQNIPLPSMFNSEIVMNLNIFKIMYSTGDTTSICFKENVNHYECIKRLLNTNCVLDAENNDKKTAYEIALEFGYRDISELLERNERENEI